MHQRECGGTLQDEKVASLAQRMEKWFQWPDQQTWLNFGGKDEPLPQEVKDKLAQLDAGDPRAAARACSRSMKSSWTSSTALTPTSSSRRNRPRKRPRPPTQRSRMKGRPPFAGAANSDNSDLQILAARRGRVWALLSFTSCVFTAI